MKARLKGALALTALIAALGLAGGQDVATATPKQAQTIAKLRGQRDTLKAQVEAQQVYIANLTSTARADAASFKSLLLYLFGAIDNPAATVPSIRAARAAAEDALPAGVDE